MSLHLSHLCDLALSNNKVLCGSDGREVKGEIFCSQVDQLKGNHVKGAKGRQLTINIWQLAVDQLRSKELDGPVWGCPVHPTKTTFSSASV